MSLTTRIEIELIVRARGFFPHYCDVYASERRREGPSWDASVLEWITFLVGYVFQFGFYLLKSLVEWMGES